MARLSESDHDLLIRISERMDRHEKTERELKEALERMARDLAEIKAQANRWKGAFCALLGIGGVIGGGAGAAGFKLFGG